jgi:hypothetical protein
MRGALAPITVSAMRHLSVHGVTTLSSMKAALPGLEAKTMNNLVMLGHVTRDPAGLAITPKGRKRLDQIDNPGLYLQPRKQFTEPARAAQLSPLEMEAAIEVELTNAGHRLTLPVLARRLDQPLHLVRPAITLMCQKGRAQSHPSKPLRYSLAEDRTSTPVSRSPSSHPTGYTCPELARNPGIQPERFAAFALPSRMGDRLHYPDGRVEPFPKMREVVA